MPKGLGPFPNCLGITVFGFVVLVPQRVIHSFPQFGMLCRTLSLLNTTAFNLCASVLRLRPSIVMSTPPVS